MLSDLRFALRSLLRHRGFTWVAVLTLALGIGSATAIFSVTDWVLFRARSFPDDVLMVGGRDPNNGPMPYRFDFQARSYAEQTDVMAEWSKATYVSGNVALGGQPLATNWLAVSANLLPILGVRPALGRGFLPGEDAAGKDQVVIVSYQFWQRHLGGSPAALGWKLRMGDQLCTIVGILPRDQILPPLLLNDLIRPLAYKVNPAQPWIPYLYLFGRLRPGIARAQAAERIAAVRPDIPPALAPFMQHDRPALSGLGELDQYMNVRIYWILLGSVGFLFAIACLNAANLMLVRMLGRRRELSIRLALGGSRWRVIRLLALESLVVAALSALVGLLVANWMMPLLLGAAGATGFAPNWALWNVDWRVAGVLAALTGLTSLLIVIVPAVRVLRSAINDGLKDGGAALGESRGLARLRGGFVVLQTAFALILLAGAGLMIATFHHLQSVNLGFDPARRVKLQIAFPPQATDVGEARLARLREIQAHLQHLPGVRAVGFGGDVLLPGYYFSTMSLQGPGDKEVKIAMVGFNLGYQHAAGIKLARGQWLTKSNGNEVLINETLARALFPGQDAVGRFLRPVGPGPNVGKDWKGWEVAGVVADIRANLRDAPGNYLYTPEGWGPAGFNTFILYLSHDYEPAFAGQATRSLYAFDPNLVAMQILPLTQSRDNQLWAERLANSVLQVLAGIALLLAVVGIFSVLAYSVDQRMPEFGVRLALGATPGDLVGRVLRRGLALAGLGVVAGLAGTLALARLLQSLLFQITAQDPWVLAGVAILLLLAAATACLLPARRASRADVTRLLRAE